jgi:hypothetical protein
MLGIAVEILASYLLLLIFARTSRDPLGLVLSNKRAVSFCLALLLSAIVCSAQQFAAAAISSTSWELSETYSWKRFADGCWYMIKSVLYEELLFRGALLFLLIRSIGDIKASAISAVAFGIYHWFTMGDWGNPVQLAFIFVITSVAGFAFAFSFAKSKTIWTPIALHLGWNIVQSIVFSNPQFGTQALVMVGEPQNGLLSMLVSVTFYLAVFPGSVILFVKYRYSTHMNGKPTPHLS